MTVMGQTQVVIGSLILVSSAVAYFATSWAILLVAFFGVALLNAGVTGVCPMACLIARMPWNRGAGCDHPAK